VRRSVIAVFLVASSGTGCGTDQHLVQAKRDSIVAAGANSTGRQLPFPFTILDSGATDSGTRVRSYEHADMPLSTMRSSTPPLTTKDGEIRQLKLDFSWSKGGFENVMLVDFTIRNHGSRAVKDFEITCRYFAPSGTEIDRNTRTIYEQVPAKGRKHIPGFNMGLIHSQVESSSCEFIDFAFAR
jgi:hypothetical protein